MLTILFGILTVWNTIWAVKLSSEGWLNLFFKLLGIALAIWCGLEFTNSIGVTSFNLN